MKKVVFVLAAGLMLASCKRAYTCTCIITTTFEDGTIHEEYVTHNDKLTKGDAKQQCKAYESSYTANDIHYKTVCDLK